jgi:hypothetical protein
LRHRLDAKPGDHTKIWHKMNAKPRVCTIQQTLKYIENDFQAVMTIAINILTHNLPVHRV